MGHVSGERHVSSIVLDAAPSIGPHLFHRANEDERLTKGPADGAGAGGAAGLAVVVVHVEDAARRVLGVRSGRARGRQGDLDAPRGLWGRAVRIVRVFGAVPVVVVWGQSPVRTCGAGPTSTAQAAA